MAEFVNQRGPSDCGIASIAMFTGRPYDEVRAAALASESWHPKKGMWSSCGVLRQLGYKQENLIGSASNDACTGRMFRRLYWDRHIFSGSFLARMMWGRPCLLSTPSLNNIGGSHMVYYDGETIHDPQRGRRGKKYNVKLEDMEPTEAVVWQCKE